MTTPFFPDVGTSKYLSWSITIEPRFKTDELMKASGRSERRQEYEQAIYGIELTYQGLSSAPAHQELQTILGFYNQMQGQYTAFWLSPPGFADVLGQQLGIGDGTKTAFTFVNTYGQSTYVEYVPGLQSVDTVYINGTPVSSGDYSVGGLWPYQLTFTSAPAADDVITADFHQLWLVRFSEDNLTFEEFVSMLFELKTCKLETVRQYTGESTTGLVWLDRGRSGEAFALAMDGSGDDLVVVGGSDDYFGNIYLSSDQGATWGAQYNAPCQQGSSWLYCSDDGLSALIDFGQTTTTGGSPWNQTSLTNPTVFAAAVSSDGSTFIGLSIDVLYGGAYKSTDGVTWTPTTLLGGYGTHNFLVAGCSGDGTVIYVVDQNYGGTGYIYFSTDGGVTWSNYTGSSFPVSATVVVSTDGSHASILSGFGTLYTTTDTGTTWTVGSAPSGVEDNWLAGSSDGDDLVYAGYNDHIWASSDQGVTWTQIDNGIPGSTYFFPGGTSGGGDDIVTGTGYPYFDAWSSTDGGSTFNNLTMGSPPWSAGELESIACGASGATIIAGTDAEGLWQSLDSGTTWTQVETASGFGYVAISQDGNTIAGAVSQSDIYASNDGGSTWSNISTGSSASGLYYTCAAVPADGIILSGTNANGLWKTTDFGATWANLVYGSSIADDAFVSVAASDDAMDIYVVTSDGDIWGTTDGGTTWDDLLAASPFGAFSWVSCSADGEVVYVSQFGLDLYRSDNKGTTWTNLTASTPLSGNYWAGVVCDPTGVNVFAATGEDGLYTSTDSGASWSVYNPTGPNPWYQVDCTPDAQTIVAANTDGSVWKTTNGGSSWSAITPPYSNVIWHYPRSYLNWRGVCISADGSIVYATFPRGFTFKSTDGGATWDANAQVMPGANDWNDVAMSTDGQIVAASGGGNAGGTGALVGYTTDGGTTWSQFLIPTNYGALSIAMSGDGQYILLGNCNQNWEGYFYGYLILTLDAGATWTDQTGAGIHRWSDVAISRNGAHMAATFTDGGSGGIYVSNDLGTTWTNTAPEPGDWSRVTIEETGAYWYATLDGTLYVSTDNGSTWNMVLSAYDDGFNVNQVAVSTMGEALIVANDQDNFVAISLDHGATWYEQSDLVATVGNMSPHLVTVNVDGNKFAIVGEAGLDDDVWFAEGVP